MEEWKRRDSFDRKVTCKLLSRSSTAPESARSIRRTALLHLYWQPACLVIAMRFNFGWSHSSNSPELSVSSKDHISVCLLLTHMHTQAAPPPHTHTFLHLPTYTYLFVRIDFVFPKAWYLCTWSRFTLFYALFSCLARKKCCLFLFATLGSAQILVQCWLSKQSICIWQYFHVKPGIYVVEQRRGGLAAIIRSTAQQVRIFLHKQAKKPKLNDSLWLA